MLSFEEYAARDATDLAELIRSGQITAAEAMDRALAAFDSLDGQINAVVIRDDAQARAEATAAPADTAFAGLPFLAKDVNVAVAGWPLTNACRYFASAAPAAVDSALAARWRAAGLVVAGRSNTPGFATDYVCEPELYGPTRNPWAPGRTPGGSSGGAAAAVAGGLVPMAHASDSGGSIRVPAACCGLFGFKPGSGLVATGAAIGPLVEGLNCHHVVTRTVRDSALMLDLTCGSEPGAPTAFAAPAGRFSQAVESPPARLRIGLCPLAPCGRAATAGITAHLDRAASLLEDMGHVVSAWSWPEGCDPYAPATALWTAEIAYFIDRRQAELGRPPEAEEIGPVIRWSLDQAARMDGAAHAHARQSVWDIRRRVARAMEGIDILMLPA